jgi:hypothetical protein
MKRRYEVWFLRLGLNDGSGAWWFRYLLMNLARDGCGTAAQQMPVQVWATWFPRASKAQHWIQGFPSQELQLSTRGTSPFHFSAGDNSIEEHSCRGKLRADGHTIRWQLHYESHFQATLSNKGWIGFSRTPHSDARFSGWIELDGRRFQGEPLGLGLQGHNCGVRHRKFWTWTHAIFPNVDGSISTLEALIYEMPLGMVFRKALLWHGGQAILCRDLKEECRDRTRLEWRFHARGTDGLRMDVALDGTGPSAHHLPYAKTNCAGTFEVTNNSLASARLSLSRPGQSDVVLENRGGTVLEMAGDPDT